MKTESTSFQKLVEIMGVIFIIVFIAYLAMTYGSLPDRIPGHFNAQGEITRYGSKSEVLVTPVLGILMYVGLTLLQMNPKIWSVPLTEANDEKKAYHNLKSMIIALKVELIGFFLYISYNQINGSNLSLYATIIFIPVVLMTLFFFILKAYSKKII